MKNVLIEINQDLGPINREKGWICNLDFVYKDTCSNRNNEQH